MLERSFDLVEFRLIIEPKASYLAAVGPIPEEKRAIAAARAAFEAWSAVPS